MSFISVIAKERFITVVSDGLVVDIATNKELEQDYQKFKKISPKQFIAYGGNRLMAETIVQTINYENTERDLLVLSNDIRRSLLKYFKPKFGSCQMAVGGIENDEIVLYSFSNNESQELVIDKPKGSNLAYSFLHGHNIGVNPAHELKKLNLTTEILKPINALKLQKDLNDIVASNDPTVNKVHFGLTIIK